MKTNLLICVLGLVVFGPRLSAAPQIVRTVEKAFTVAPGDQLRLSTGGGHATIVTSTNDKLTVTATQRIAAASEAEADKLLKNLRLTIAQRGDTVSAAARYAVSVDSFETNPVEVDFVVSMPARLNVDLKTAGGDAVLPDITGKVTATLMGGDFTSGRIEGDARVTSGGGDVKVAAVTGALTVSSLGGDIDVHAVFDAVKASTTGGDITVTFAGEIKEDSSLSSGSGDVHVIVKRTAVFELEARAAKGEVESKALALAIKRGDQKQHQLEGLVNGGSRAKLKLRSNSGDIKIEAVP